MMNKTPKCGYLGVFTVLFAVLFTIFSLAAEPNYKITYAGWADDSKDGRVIAEWERADDSSVSKTKYKIRLYRGSTSNPVGDWKTVSGTKYEFSEMVLAKGTGKYFFTVYPTRGGEEMKVTSEVMEVDGTQKKKLSAYYESLLKQEAENFENGIKSDGTRYPEGWQYSGGSWYYRQTDGKLKKACWLQDKGKWYYLSSSGAMLTGWQAINSKWYFFGTDGALYVNTVTPDGSTVNENGEWVENGVVVTDERKKTRKADASTVSIISEFAVGMSEKEETEGELYKVSMKNTSVARLVGESYSIPQEEWVPGQAVTITVTYEAYAGYAFSDSTIYYCARATVLSSQSGEDATLRTIVLSYVPNLKLKTPDHFYMDSDSYLRWDKSPHASYYEVRVYSNDELLGKKTVESAIINLSEYMAQEYVTVKVFAKPGSEEKSYKAKSSTAVLENITSPEVQEKLLVPGRIIRNTDGSMNYRDEGGSLVTDRWVELAGDWYHFDSYGRAENQGWYLDSTGYWYYFDDKHRMVTGTITEGGKTYHLNDGTRKDLPLGARY